MNENKIHSVPLLAVSEDGALLQILGSLLDFKACPWESVANGWEAMERVQSGNPDRLLVLDIPPGDSENLHFLRWLRRLRADLPVVVVCQPEDTVGKEEAVRLGASEVIVRPANREQLQSILGRHCESAARGNSDVAFAATEPIGNHTFFFSASLAMQKLRTQAELLAQSDVPVLILGEKGSGKRTVASLIHKLSVRSGFGLRRVQCSEVPASLLEREIFGQTSLSFSSASADNSSSEEASRFEDLGQPSAISPSAKREQFSWMKSPPCLPRFNRG